MSDYVVGEGFCETCLGPKLANFCKICAPNQLCQKTANKGEGLQPEVWAKRKDNMRYHIRAYRDLLTDSDIQFVHPGEGGRALEAFKQDRVQAIRRKMSKDETKVENARKAIIEFIDTIDRLGLKGLKRLGKSSRRQRKKKPPTIQGVDQQHQQMGQQDGSEAMQSASASISTAPVDTKPILMQNPQGTLPQGAVLMQNPQGTSMVQNPQAANGSYAPVFTDATMDAQIFHDAEGFHANIHSVSDCEKFLLSPEVNSFPLGSFILWKGEMNIMLSIVQLNIATNARCCTHHIVYKSRPQGMNGVLFALGPNGPDFPTLTELVQCYKKNNLSSIFPCMDAMLTQAVVFPTPQQQGAVLHQQTQMLMTQHVYPQHVYEQQQQQHFAMQDGTYAATQ